MGVVAGCGLRVRPRVTGSYSMRDLKDSHEGTDSFLLLNFSAFNYQLKPQGLKFYWYLMPPRSGYEAIVTGRLNGPVREPNSPYIDQFDLISPFGVGHTVSIAPI